MSIRIAVLSGGRSGEHEVSRRSGESIVAHLDPATYQVTQVLIGRDGSWSIDGEPATLPAALSMLCDQDVVFPAFHGPYGEDGTVQSMLEWLDVPYVGNGVLASAAGMDKAMTKTLLAADGLRTAAAVTLRPGDELSQEDQWRLGLPVFVKPARAGSSLGVSRVENWSQLPAALDKARQVDEKVLVEQAVSGREIDVAVLQYPDGRVVAGPPLEIVADAAFFDYDAKYDGSAVFHIPAALDSVTTQLLQDRAVQAFQSLGCRGLLRVDFFLPGAAVVASRVDGLGSQVDAADGSAPIEPVVNEVNTFPGFTNASQYPRIWQQAGLGFPQLLDILIEGGRTLPTAGTPVTSGQV
ncbi:D-alanine--D-alanine ligase family protein [Micromonospora sp. NBC_01813]|uniref:D-alanine--D-alanine ligase family protein n=1 Tax=Micromonospora sp. NBC_01813 TaxID=2975988 RepID=UPI002DD9407B|nr:D-alanine--D-alanine ligase family protein [Micromonospora sp. NBC_01813]WSA10129.1 D-alanine--D-alanine ligase [Micromonospora sp. NBC_01813]